MQDARTWSQLVIIRTECGEPHWQMIVFHQANIINHPETVKFIVYSVGFVDKLESCSIFVSAFVSK